MNANQKPVAKVTDVAPGTTRKVTAGGVDVLLANCGGRIYAIEDVCTHDGGALDQGTLLDECRIECPRHGATFDLTTGAALTLPAVVPVATFAVRMVGDDIYVDL
jgi:3-phenylpropionate/trans-cinnamate dioxygenase ferredoxin subunit